MLLNLVTTLLLVQHTLSEPDALDPSTADNTKRCCFEGQPAGSCSNDPYCAGTLECSDTGYPCGGSPSIECQDCGCCPCCEKSHACCKPTSDDSNAGKAMSFTEYEQQKNNKQTASVQPSTVRIQKPKAKSSFRVDVRGEASPNYNKGECRPECSNNCNGHGNCLPAPAGSCPANTCVCDKGFDPSTICADCFPINWGATCTSCPAIVNGKVCSGHGYCDGAGTAGGTGTCTCNTGFDIATECAMCVDTSYGSTCKSCPNVVDGKVCSGHGTCDGAGTLSGTGTCTCTDGFDVQLDCEQCLPLHWGETCSICPGVISPGTSPAEACSGHGLCNGDGSKQQGTGKCSCSYGWQGDDCAELYCPKGCKHG